MIRVRDKESGANLGSITKEQLQFLIDQLEEETEEDGFFRRECSYGSFLRTLPLSFHAEPDQVKAKFKDGVLHVSLPKTQNARPRKIDIQH